MAFTAGGTGSATTTAAQLSSNAPCDWVLLQADPDNTNDLFWGGPASQTIQLLPGDERIIPVSNASQVYVKTATSTATYNWQAYQD